MLLIVCSLIVVFRQPSPCARRDLQPPTASSGLWGAGSRTTPRARTQPGRARGVGRAAPDVRGQRGTRRAEHQPGRHHGSREGARISGTGPVL